jgi:PAS domain S-box-containing protein
MLANRTTSVDNLNSFLESILAGFRVAVTVVDDELSVLEWNPKAEAVWGPRRDEVPGKHILNLGIGLALDPWSKRDGTLAGETLELAVGTTNRRGGPITVRLQLTPLTRGSNGMEGAIALIEDRPAESTKGTDEPPRWECSGAVRRGRTAMEEFEVEIPGMDSWAVSMALVEEFVHSWRAEVQEYDITPTGGTITLIVPRDPEFRIASPMPGRPSRSPRRS